LKFFSASGNKIKTLPEELNALVKLKSLALSNNALGPEIAPHSLGTLVNLVELFLSGNMLKKIPVEICTLENLEHLDLSQNILVSLPEQIQSLVKLTDFNLGSNNLSSLPESIGKLTNLTNLNLVDNRLLDLPVPIGNCTKLGNGLNIAKNPIKNERLLKKFNQSPQSLMNYLQRRVHGTTKTQERKLNESSNNAPSEKSTPPATPADMLRDLTVPKPSSSTPKRQEGDISSDSPPKSDTLISLEESGSISEPDIDPNLKKKLSTLFTWANTCIRNEMRPKILKLKNSITAASSVDSVQDFVPVVKTVKLHIKKLSPVIELQQRPYVLDKTLDKLTQFKSVLEEELSVIELALTDIMAIVNSEIQGDVNDKLRVIHCLKDINKSFSSIVVEAIK